MEWRIKLANPDVAGEIPAGASFKRDPRRGPALPTGTGFNRSRVRLIDWRTLSRRVTAKRPDRIDRVSTRLAWEQNRLPKADSRRHARFRTNQNILDAPIP